MTRLFLSIAATAVALGGCALLSTPEPEQLYRIGLNTPAAATPARAPTTRLALDAGSFPREAAGVRIVTTEGPRVSYLAGARWAAPAPQMFEAALMEAVGAGGATLYPPGAGDNAGALMRVDVTRFEAAYENGAELAPTVIVAGNARIMNRTNRRITAERRFSARVPAGANTVTDVVAAYEAATAQVLGELATWTQSAGPSS